MGTRRRYAIMGTGGRAVMYVDAICGPYRDDTELVALGDVNDIRMAWHNRRIGRRHGLSPVPEYAAGDFDRMISDTRPDEVIVTTPDVFHHVFISRALTLGCDVITEKPLATDQEALQAILDAAKATGRRLRVAFNYRYMPAFSALRRLVAEGAVGVPKLVDFTWVLDTRHGADYFRRWHRRKDRSGGLLVHKASHHFDLVNWWIDDVPERVFAMGGLEFYGRENATGRGESYPYERYTGTPEAEHDPFALFLDRHRGLRGLYLDAEPADGYLRDQNVFGDGITIEDTMAVTARYHRGACLSYSLVAYSPWEGLRVAITGTRGRIELDERHGSHVIAGQSDAELAAEQGAGFSQVLRVFPMFEPGYEHPVPPAEGGHGGADPLMLSYLLSPDPPADELARAASHRDGAAAALVGIAANRSMATGSAVDCAPLLGDHAALL